MDVAVVAASAPERPVYKVHYEDDEEEEELEEEEIRPLLVIDGLLQGSLMLRYNKREVG